MLFTRGGRSCLIPAVIAGAVLFIATGARASELSPDEARVMGALVKAVEADQWKKSRELAGQLRDPVAVKLAQWLHIVEASPDVGFGEINRFIAENPTWPNRSSLQLRAEESMPEGLPSDAVLAFFKEREPKGPAGKVKLGQALIQAGRAPEGMSVIRNAWIEANFANQQEIDFYKRHKQTLRTEDHQRRLDRLLWEGKHDAARRMLMRVPPDWRALAEARVALRAMRGGADRAVSRVPASLQNDPGLQFERARWRRVKGKDADARQLLSSLPPPTQHAAKWWNERAIVARRALQKGYISDAYFIAKSHGMQDGADFAEAEWLAGWIALRFLNEPKWAEGHFQAMMRGVAHPIGQARAAYWGGRTAEVLNDKAKADELYRQAARFPTVYYGQLAANRLKPGARLNVAPEPEASNEDLKAFAKHELVRAVRILAQADESDRIRPFIMALLEDRPSHGWRALTARLARGSGRLDLAIGVAKKSAQAGAELIESGYPEIDPPALPKRDGIATVEVPLVLAVVRQESAFHVKAVSSAGALGLMQLLPSTAKGVAKALDEPFAQARLTADPQYNLKLGQAYLRDMVRDFSGSYVLALAAYNAGPARAREWIKLNGDPRAKDIDAIDWIEAIPFEETRGYVQRVLESLQIYRLRRARSELIATLESDLRR